MVKNLPASAGDRAWVESLGQEDPLEQEMATHSNILAWKNPCTEKPGRLQSMGSQSQTQLTMCNTHTHTHTTLALSCVQHLIIHLPMSQHLFLRNLQSVEPLSTIKIYMFQQTKQNQRNEKNKLIKILKYFENYFKKRHDHFQIIKSSCI